MTNTILLADDSVTIQKVIELTFMDEDYEVVAVGNGDEALDRLEEVTPDVVIADVHMPGASGYDVARRAKQLHPQAPVLLLVGTFEPFDEADFQASGADAYLKKPFDSQELLHRVSELMAARAGMPLPAAAAPAEAPAPPADAGQALPAGPLADAAAPPATAAAPAPPSPGTGAETQFVPTWNEEAAGEQPDPLGTRQMPTFGGGEPAAAEPPATPGEEETPAWSSWGLTSEPEEVAPPTPLAEAEPAWPAGDPFEPAWDSVEAREADQEMETPSWALEDTEEVADVEVAAAEPAPPPTPSGSAAAAPRHAEEPFPELARPRPAAGAPPEPGVAAGASPAATAIAGAEARLSEADVDRVARRVAEMLGEQVVREVAWEVVPDLAEVVIKDRLRELESQVD